MRRGPVAFLALIVIAGAVAGAVTLFRTQAAGETAPTATPTVTPPPTGTPTVTPTAGPTPTATPLSASLAAQTVTAYWNDIASGKFAAAYALLTAQSQQQESQQSFASTLKAFVGVTPNVSSNASVDGTRATVAVNLLQPSSTSPIAVTQHLLWENQSWRIDTTNAG